MKILNKIKNLIKDFLYYLTGLPYKYFGHIRLNQPVFDDAFEKSFWTIFLGLLTGIFWISFIAWNRLIRDRLPRVIELEPFTIQFYITLYLFLNFLVLVIIYSHKLMLEIKKWRKIEHKPNRLLLRAAEIIKNYPTPRLDRFYQFINNYILLAPLYLWRFIFLNTPLEYRLPLQNIFYRLGIRLCKIYSVEIDVVLYNMTLVNLVYFPRLICFSVFCYEVVIKKELYHFYHIAIILLIPLIFFCLRRIFFDMSYYEILRFEEEYIKVISRGEITEDHPYGNNIVVEKKHDWIPDELYAQAKRNFDKYRGIYLLAYNFYRHSAKYDYIVNLITYILLMISFGVWLFQI